MPMLILIHWQQMSDIESKGDQLSYSAECMIRTQDHLNRISSRLKVHPQTNWAIEHQTEALNSIASHHDQQAFSPFDPTAEMASPWLWRYMCLLVLILMHQQQEIDIKLKGDKLSSSAEWKIWTHDLWNQISSRLKARSQTNWAI